MTTVKRRWPWRLLDTDLVASAYAEREVRWNPPQVKWSVIGDPSRSDPPQEVVVEVLNLPPEEAALLATLERLLRTLGESLTYGPTLTRQEQWEERQRRIDNVLAECNPALPLYQPRE